MSSHPIERRHVRPVVRRPDARRAMTIAVLFAATFALAFLVGHTRSPGVGGERLPPSIPKVPTPVSAALAAAPAIDLGVLEPPPAPRPAPSHATTPPAVTSSTPVTTTPAVTTPTVTSPAAESTPTESAPAKASEPAPVQSSPRSSGGSSKSGGAGTSFESSG
jgi:hypothetical protein